MNSETYQLVVRKGPTPGQIFPLESDLITVGRDPLSDIVIDDPEVSRHHARLTLSGGAYLLQDRGSTNGSFVDGARLGGDPVQLKAGQVIMFGTTVTMVFQAIPAEDPMATVVAPAAAISAEEPPEIEEPPAVEEIEEPEPALEIELPAEPVMEEPAEEEPEEAEAVFEFEAEAEEPEVLEEEEELPDLVEAEGLIVPEEEEEEVEAEIPPSVEEEEEEEEMATMIEPIPFQPPEEPAAPEPVEPEPPAMPVFDEPEPELDEMPVFDEAEPEPDEMPVFDEPEPEPEEMPASDEPEPQVMPALEEPAAEIELPAEPPPLEPLPSFDEPQPEPEPKPSLETPIFGFERGAAEPIIDSAAPMKDLESASPEQPVIQATGEVVDDKESDNRNRNIIIGVVAFVVLCCLCIAVGFAAYFLILPSM